MLSTKRDRLVAAGAAAVAAWPVVMGLAVMASEGVAAMRTRRTSGAERKRPAPARRDHRGLSTHLVGVDGVESRGAPARDREQAAVAA